VDRKLQGKIAIVTGAAGGIGGGIAKRFLIEGAKVLLVDFAEDKLQESLACLQKEHGQNVAAFTADLTQAPVYAPKVVRYAEEVLGTADILVNCAGIYPSTMALDITEADWDRVFDLNAKGYFFMAQAAAKAMLAAGKKGRILNISSTASEIARPGVAHYCSSKAAIKMMTQVLALEWAKYGINVNALGPGLIETETLVNTLVTEEAKREHREKLSLCPQERAGTVDEIAEIAVFFVSSSADFVTGQTLLADGGYAAGKCFQSKK
jgi:NAD(P)-dependent dehydrogenase (short-subunit alcohol dehydrogenase family)